MMYLKTYENFTPTDILIRKIDGKDIKISLQFIKNDKELAIRIQDLLDQHGKLDLDGDLELLIPITGSEIVDKETNITAHSDLIVKPNDNCFLELIRYEDTYFGYTTDFFFVNERESSWCRYKELLDQYVEICREIIMNKNVKIRIEANKMGLY